MTLSVDRERAYLRGRAIRASGDRSVADAELRAREGQTSASGIDVRRGDLDKRDVGRAKYDDASRVAGVGFASASSALLDKES